MKRCKDLRPWTVFAVCCMLFGMAVMGSLLFVVTHHPKLQTDEYKVAVWMGIQYAIGYFIMSVIYTKVVRKKTLLPLLLLVGLPSWSNFRYSLRVGGIIGLLWSLNYICAFVAGAYIPNAMQTIFAQLQMVLTYFVNFGLFKNPLKSAQHLIIGAFIGISLGSSVFVSGTGLFSVPGLSTTWTVIWCLVYLLNSLAAGLATNCVEALMEAARDERPHAAAGAGTDSDSAAHQKEIVYNGYSEMDFILAVNVVSGVWMVVFDLIPLFGVAALAYRGNVFHQVFLDWSAMASPSGQLLILLLSLASWIYTTSSYYAIVQCDALFVAVVIAACNLAQVAVFNNASLVTSEYYSPATVPQWEVNAVATVLSILYAVAPRIEVRDGRLRLAAEDPNKNNRVRESVIGRYYQRFLDERKAEVPKGEERPLLIA